MWAMLLTAGRNVQSWKVSSRKICGLFTLFGSLTTCLILFKACLSLYGTKAQQMASEFPKTLQGFGYTFNDEGKLRKIDPATGKATEEGFDFNISSDAAKNQRHYEALGEAVTERVYEILEENGMHKVYVPENVPKEDATFIFLSKPKLEKPKKLLILIHGSGVVRAGQWSRSLIINHSLDHGTQLPYIKKARELGYEILITNTNDNYRTKDGVERPIPGHSSPKAHAFNVWEKYVIGSDPECVGIVAHSYGGVVTVELAKKYLNFFKERVFAVGFTDSVHSMFGCTNDVQSFLSSIGRNWVTSIKPLNEGVSSSGSDIARYSAGHTKHEWTSYSCISALFEYFERRYRDVSEKKQSKKPKLEL